MESDPAGENLLLSMLVIFFGVFAVLSFPNRSQIHVVALVLLIGASLSIF
jgi:hypothetical protein